MFFVFFTQHVRVFVSEPWTGPVPLASPSPLLSSMTGINNTRLFPNDQALAIHATPISRSCFVFKSLTHHPLSLVALLNVLFSVRHALARSQPYPFLFTIQTRVQSALIHKTQCLRSAVCCCLERTLLRVAFSMHPVAHEKEQPF